MDTVWTARFHTRGWESHSGEVSFALKLNDKKPSHEEDKEGDSYRAEGI